MDPKAKLYFERSVIKYSKGDVEALLKAELPCAGPLLSTIMNGIDNLGGMCYGFKSSNVGDRSRYFLHERMGLSEELAAFLYESVRCGIVHQGMPKMGLEFLVQYDSSEGSNIISRQSEKYLLLNVTALAHCYLKTIEEINAEPGKYIKYYPQYSEKQKNKLMGLFSAAKKDIDITQIYTLRQYEVDEDERRTAGQSSAAYTGQMHYGIDLPPDDE